MPTPIEDFAQRAVGTVEAVSPDNFSVLLDTDAPRSTAFVEGAPIGFPRINSYVLIPNESGAVVGMVTWLGVEGSPFPKRSGFKDFGVVDLPFPLRKISVSPVGTLSELDSGEYRLDRGVKIFPSVGDPVILPSRTQTQCIVQGDTSERRVNIGTCPSAYGSPVRVDPNKLFGRHLALLGNTGSGKSCTAAWILRSCLETTQKSLNSGTLAANARFIILDPNGEYSSCFSDLGNGCRVFQVPPLDSGKKAFALPAWMWNSAEWAAITQAAPRTQRPLLIETLRILRASTTGIDRTETSVVPLN